MMRLRQMLLIAALVVPQPTFAQSPAAGGPAMTLTTTAFPDGDIIPVKFSQAAEGAAPGEGRSPALTWTNVPAGTRSLFLHMHDLDVARMAAIDGHVLGKAVYTGRFRRPQ